MFARRLSVLSVLILALSGTATIALAEPNPLPPQTIAQRGPGPRGPRGPQGAIQELNLSDQQLQDLENIRLKYQDEMNERRQVLIEAQQELNDMMSGEASVGQIRNQYRQVAQLGQQLGDLRFESMIEMREVLTPEQRRQFRSTECWRRAPAVGTGGPTIA